MTPSITRRAATVTAILTLTVACGESRGPDPDFGQPASTRLVEHTTPRSTATAADPVWSVVLGRFPEFPEGPLADSVSAGLQALLDAAVEENVLDGAAAAVIVAGSGSWSGAAGVADVTERDVPLDAGSVLSTASVGKTVIAAQVLQLADEGKLRLDDPATDHIPAEFTEFPSGELQAVTIRELLGMRSGLTDGATHVIADPGTTPVYANANYDILSVIVDQVENRRLPDVVSAGVLHGRGLEGLVFDADDVRFPHDGHMRADVATMARWGYELYGGHVLSESYLQEMLSFAGEWYGLGVIDFTHPDLPAGGTYDSPSVGHGGAGDAEVIRLVAFPEHGVVVYLWATPQVSGGPDARFAAIRPLVEELRDAAHP